MELQRLIEAVECGDVMDWGFHQGYPRIVLQDNWELGMKSFCGSLDAAKTLHDALLPGWSWKVHASSDGSVVIGVYKPKSIFLNDHSYFYTDKSPARAWLLAILKAYQAQLNAA